MKDYLIEKGFKFLRSFKGVEVYELVIYKHKQQPNLSIVIHLGKNIEAWLVSEEIDRDFYIDDERPYEIKPTPQRIEAIYYGLTGKKL